MASVCPSSSGFAASWATTGRAGPPPAPAAAQRVVAELLGSKAAISADATIGQLYGHLSALPFAIAPPSIGPWIERGRDVFAGAQPLIVGGKLAAGRAMGDVFASLGASAYWAQASAAGASALATAIAGGSAQDAVRAGIQAISPALAAVVPYGTAAAAALNAGVAIWSSFGGSKGPPPISIAGQDWKDFSTLVLTDGARALPSDDMAEVLGRMGGGGDVAGQGALDSRAIAEVRSRWPEIVRQACQDRENGTLKGPGINTLPPPRYRRIALAMAYAPTKSYIGPKGVGENDPVLAKYAFEMAAWAMPRVMLRQTLVAYLLYRLSLSGDNSKTSKRARREGPDVYWSMLSSLLVKAPSTDANGIYSASGFPLKALDEEKDYYRAFPNTGTGRYIIYFDYGGAVRWWRMPTSWKEENPGPLANLATLHWSREDRYPKPWGASDDLLPAPNVALDHALTLALLHPRVKNELADDFKEMREQAKAAHAANEAAKAGDQAGRNKLEKVFRASAKRLAERQKARAKTERTQAKQKEAKAAGTPTFSPVAKALLAAAGAAALFG